MPYPRWLARINKRVFNPREVRRAQRPILTHVGRSSGVTYQTPLDAVPTTAGYVLVVRYGPDSDWVRNTLAAGSATLRIAGQDQQLTSPRMVSQREAAGQLAPGFEPDADIFKAEHYLMMDLAE